MLSPDDRRAIEGLFERLRDVERNGAPRDAEAEQLIIQKIREMPGAPYYMAQTVVVQEQALNMAEQRIEELERQVQSRPAGGGFLDNLFGNANRGGTGRPEQPVQQRQARGPWDRDDGYAPGQGYGGGYGRGMGGGFLAGAAQTAMGVAGGVLLGNAIAGMFAGEANASEFDQGDAGADAQDTGAEDTGVEDTGGDDFGGDGGDFDLGGDF